MTYTVDSYVIYGTVGVCKVESIGALNFSKEESDKIYYTLSPLYSEGSIYIPVNTQKHIRPVITQEEAIALIEMIPQVKEEDILDSNITNIAQHYTQNIKSNDCLSLVSLIKGIYNKKKSLPENKKLGQIDERYMKQAEELLYGELAVALDIPKDSVAAYITDYIKSIKKGRV